MFWTKTVSVDQIKQHLQDLQDLKSNAHLVDMQSVQAIIVEKGHVLITLEVDPAKASNLEETRQAIEKSVRSIKAVQSAQVILTADKKEPPQIQTIPQRPKAILPNVKNIIAVASGKGGVGKSTVAANLAVALAAQGQKVGKKVGLLDADIYGPSVPSLFGLRGQKPSHDDQDQLIPLQAHGVSVMSMGFLVAEETPMVWRGPMAQSALLQMLRDVAWGDLDILVIDMPPGTGDIQLTLAQKVSLAGAIIVSTPQDLALLDAVKAIEMFRKVSVPILGIVENMSLFCCPNCGQTTSIFGTDGARKRAEEMNIPFLGTLPLDPNLRMASDQGVPLSSELFDALALKILQSLEHKQKPPPKIIIE
jgi:ATP-binding protein involved in chromosome partitioning